MLDLQQKLPGGGRRAAEFHPERERASPLSGRQGVCRGPEDAPPGRPAEPHSAGTGQLQGRPQAARGARRTSPAAAYLRAPSRPHPTAPARPRLARTPGDLQEVGPTSRAAAVSPFRGVGPRRRWLPPGVRPAGEGGGRRRAPAHWPPGATPAGSRGSRTQGQGASSDPRAWWVGAAARGPGARGPGAGDMGMVRWSPCSLPRVSLLE